MLVKGSGGEKYALDTKRKRTCRTYTDYPVGGGVYVARIMDRNHRNGTVEAEVKDAVNSGSYYNEERPLNVLYTGRKFAGFLYEGDGSLLEDMQTEDAPEGAYAPVRGARGGNGAAAVLCVQGAVAVVMALIGYFAIYPMLRSYMDSNEESAILSALHYLDYYGVPAILVGIALQAFAWKKFQNYMDNLLVGGLIALVANLMGTVLWTIFVMLIMTIVMGAVAFIMKYIVVIILIFGVWFWIKSKLNSRGRR